MSNSTSTSSSTHNKAVKHFNKIEKILKENQFKTKTRKNKVSDYLSARLDKQKLLIDAYMFSKHPKKEVKKSYREFKKVLEEGLRNAKKDNAYTKTTIINNNTYIEYVFLCHYKNNTEKTSLVIIGYNKNTNIFISLQSFCKTKKNLKLYEKYHTNLTKKLLSDK